MRDEHGNKIVSGAEIGSLAAYSRQLPDGPEPGIEATLKDNGDGTYDITYELPQGGGGLQYEISVSLSGEEIGSTYLGPGGTGPQASLASPYTIETLPPNVDPALTFAFGSKLTQDDDGVVRIAAEAGKLTSFNIQPVDTAGRYLAEMAEGNLIKVIQAEGDLVAQGGVLPFFETDFATASIKVVFGAFRVRPVKLQVLIIYPGEDGVPVETPLGFPKDGLITVDVKPGLPIANTSYTRDDYEVRLKQFATAGQQHSYQVRLRDAYNNNLLYDPFAIKPNVKFAPPGRSRARSAVGVVSAAAVVFYIYIIFKKIRLGAPTSKLKAFLVFSIQTLIYYSVIYHHLWFHSKAVREAD